jgi:hypothetical protein
MGEEKALRTLAEALSELPDPRRKQRQAHGLVPILLMTVAALLSGSRSLYAVAQWGRERREDDPEMLGAFGLKVGQSPSHPTLHRVFKRLDVQAFERILSEWLAQTGLRLPSDGLEFVAMDGKSLRGIHGEEVPGVHLVAAYALQTGRVLAQQAASGKGEELNAVKAVLRSLPLTNRVVLGDALQTQREICQTILDKGGTIFSSSSRTNGPF